MWFGAMWCADMLMWMHCEDECEWGVELCRIMPSHAMPCHVTMSMLWCFHVGCGVASIACNDGWWSVHWGATWCRVGGGRLCIFQTMVSMCCLMTSPSWMFLMDLRSLTHCHRPTLLIVVPSFFRHFFFPFPTHTTSSRGFVFTHTPHTPHRLEQVVAHFFGDLFGRVHAVDSYAHWQRREASTWMTPQRSLEARVLVRSHGRRCGHASQHFRCCPSGSSFSVQECGECISWKIQSVFRQCRPQGCDVDHCLRRGKHT